jgi:hypothetical protein
MYWGVPTSIPLTVNVEGSFHRFGDPEVRHSRVPVREQDVLGLDIAVGDPMPVRVLQGVDHLAGEPHRLLHRQLPFPPEAVAKGLPLDLGHGVPELAVGVAGIRHRQDVRMLYARPCGSPGGSGRAAP